MVDISTWLVLYMDEVKKTFGDRVWFVGLQGSYARAEATDHSDIDVVLILDNLSLSDIHTYQLMLDRLPERALICGFFSGRNELLHWDPADLFQFYHDTKPICGDLNDLIPLLDETAVDRAIKVGAGNIYHGCLHNMLHGRSENVLRGLYKSAVFVVQAVLYRQIRQYISKMEDLIDVASSNDRSVIEISRILKSGGEVNFDSMSEALFLWAQALLTQ